MEIDLRTFTSRGVRERCEGTRSTAGTSSWPNLLRGEAMFFVEIHYKSSAGPGVPLVQFVRTEEDAKRLCDSAANGWTYRGYGKDGVVIWSEVR